MFSSSIFSNYLGSMLGLAVSKGLRFLAVILCVRFVGDATWGQAVSTIAVLGFLTYLVDQGLGSSPLLFRLSSRASDSRLLLLISGYRLAMAFLVIALLHAFHHVVHPLDPLLLLYSWILLSRALILDWWFIRRQLYQVTLLIGSVRTLIFFGLVAALIRPGSGSRTILLIEMGSEAFACLLAYLLMRWARRREPTEALAPSLGFGMGELLLYSLPFFLIGVLNTVQSSMDILLLRLLRGAEAVAQYDIGAKVGFLYFFLGATVIQILRPKLTLLYQAGDSPRMGLILRTTSSVLLLFTCLFLVPSLFFSAEIMQWIFGAQSPVTVEVFRWVALWVGTSFLSMLCADTLLSLGRRRDYVKAALAGAVVNVLANLLFIRLFSAYGAIFAKVLSEAVIFGTALFHLPAPIRREISASLRFQVAMVGSMVLCYACSVMAGYRGLWVAAALAITGFGVRRAGVFTRRTLAVLREN